MTVEEFFTRVGDMLIDREHGPMKFRLMMQPLVAVCLAIRFGLQDAREGNPPFYFWAIFADPARRPELIASACKQVGKVFIVAFLLDVIYELIVYHWIYPTQALIVAFVLAFIPYLLVRGPVTRIASRFLRKGLLNWSQRSDLN